MPHIHDKIDFTVEVFIIHNNKVLLRRHDKYKMWLGVGGHIELDEDPVQAGVRECKEEVGLDVVIVGNNLQFDDIENKELIPPLFMNRHWINKTHEHVTFVYVATSKTDDVREGSAHEHSSSIKWFTATELDDPSYALMGNIVHYAKKALEFTRV